LLSIPESNRPSATRYSTWFGTYGKQRYDTIISHFEKIWDAFANKGITFNCDCSENYFAYVFPTKPYEIFLCKLFWNALLTGTDSRSGTIVHETSHFNVVAGTDDHVYGQQGCKDLAKSAPSKAIDNADSHEYFAENTPQLAGGSVVPVLELAWWGNNWHYRGIISDAGGLPASSTTRLTSTLLNGDPRVYYAGIDNMVHELAWWGNNWHYRPVGADANAVPVRQASDLTSTLLNGGPPCLLYWD
jgi:hypothetical protein